MDQLIFKASFLGNKTEVFQDRVVYNGLFGILANITIPIKEISSIHLGAIWTPGVMIETSRRSKIRFVSTVQ